MNLPAHDIPLGDLTSIQHAIQLQTKLKYRAKLISFFDTSLWTHELRGSEENVEAVSRSYLSADETFFQLNQAFLQHSFHQASITDPFPQNIQQAAYSSPGYFMPPHQTLFSLFLNGASPYNMATFNNIQSLFPSLKTNSAKTSTTLASGALQ